MKNKTIIKNQRASVLILIFVTCLFIFFMSTTFAKSDVEKIKNLLKNGKYLRADIVITNILENNLNNPEILFYKGIIETNLNENNKAIDTFRDLTERFPELPEPFNNLAVLYAKKSQYRLAKEILEQAIKTNPSYLTAHINLGDIYTKMASEAYNKALEIDKSNNIAITKLSMITQLFNYQPNTKNTAINSINSITEKNKIKVVKLTKKELSTKILRAIDNWKAAWENKDMEGYLSSYDSNFQYPNNMSKPDWEQYRTSRIISKKTINISLSNIELKFGKNKITATFIQNYKSGALNQTSNKTLVLIGNEGDWLILSEASE
jgi:tetratricopeptide (TPR) repeat protein